MTYYVYTILMNRTGGWTGGWTGGQAGPRAVSEREFGRGGACCFPWSLGFWWFGGGACRPTYLAASNPNPSDYRSCMRKLLSFFFRNRYAFEHAIILARSILSHISSQLNLVAALLTLKSHVPSLGFHKLVAPLGIHGRWQGCASV